VCSSVCKPISHPPPPDPPSAYRRLQLQVVAVAEDLAVLRLLRVHRAGAGLGQVAAREAGRLEAAQHGRAQVKLLLGDKELEAHLGGGGGVWAWRWGGVGQDVGGEELDWTEGVDSSTRSSIAAKNRGWTHQTALEERGCGPEPLTSDFPGAIASM